MDASPSLLPSWRRDLTREIDLIEEVARIYGYDANTRGRRRADGRFDQAPRRPRAGKNPRRPDRLGHRRSVDLERGRRAILRGLQPLDRRRTASHLHAGHPRREFSAPQLDSQLAGRAKDERSALESGNRTVRDRQNLSAASEKTARRASHARHHQRAGLFHAQGRHRIARAKAEMQRGADRRRMSNCRCSIPANRAGWNLAEKRSAILGTVERGRTEAIRSSRPNHRRRTETRTALSKRRTSCRNTHRCRRIRP